MTIAFIKITNNQPEANLESVKSKEGVKSKETEKKIANKNKMKNTGENKSREKPETINTHNKNSEQDISQEVECIKQPGKYRKQ